MDFNLINSRILNLFTGTLIIFQKENQIISFKLKCPTERDENHNLCHILIVSYSYSIKVTRHRGVYVSNFSL